MDRDAMAPQKVACLGLAPPTGRATSSDDDLKLHFPLKMPRCLSLRLLPCGRMLPRGWGGGVFRGVTGTLTYYWALGAGRTRCRNAPIVAPPASRPQ